MSKKFTLNELIISVIVIAILAAIVLLNVSGFLKDGKESAYAANEREVQSAVDRYHLDHELYPTLIQPTKLLPQLVEYDLLVPKYIKKRPKQDFWVEGDGTVIGKEKDLTNDFPEEFIKYNSCEEAKAAGYDKCITTKEELSDIRADLSLRYILMNDIDLKEVSNWTSIGSKTTPFIGELNGNGYSVDNFSLNMEIDKQGMFNYTQDSLIQNIKLNNISIQGFDESGTLVGTAVGTSVINNVIITGNIENGGYDFGGLIGSNGDSYDNAAVVKNVISDISYTGDLSNSGGVIGGNYALAEKIHSKVNMNGIGSRVGGVLSANYGKFKEVYAHVDILLVGNEIGGILGVNYNEISENLQSSGKMEVTGSTVGGIIGQSMTSAILSDMTSTVEVIASGREVGGIIGAAYGEVANLTSKANVTGDSSVGGVIGKASYPAFNLTSTGDVTGREKIGGVIGSTSGTSDNLTNEGNVKGTGDYVGGVIGETYGPTNNSTSIGNVSGRGSVGGVVGYSSNPLDTLTHKGDVSGEEDYVGGIVGQLSGDSYNLSSVGNVEGGKNYVGGAIGYSTGRNVDTSTNKGSVSGKGDYVGGVVGYASGDGSNLINEGDVSGFNLTGGIAGQMNGNLKDSTSTSNILGKGDNVGGVVGLIYYKITNSTSSGTVVGEGNNTGGIVGESYNVVENSNYKGTVKGKGNYVGGISGKGYNSITNSYAVADIESEGDYTGGIVGQFYGQLENTYYSGKLDTVGDYVGGLVGNHYQGIYNSYATGELHAKGDYIAGIIGMYSIDTMSIQNVYSDMTIVSDKSSDSILVADPQYAVLNTLTSVYWNSNKYSSGLFGLGKTEDELKDINTFIGWDFSTIWELKPGTKPQLRE